MSLSPGVVLLFQAVTVTSSVIQSVFLPRIPGIGQDLKRNIKINRLNWVQYFGNMLGQYRTAQLDGDMVVKLPNQKHWIGYHKDMFGQYRTIQLDGDMIY